MPRRYLHSLGAGWVVGVMTLLAGRAIGLHDVMTIILILIAGMGATFYVLNR